MFHLLHSSCIAQVLGVLNTVAVKIVVKLLADTVDINHQGVHSVVRSFKRCRIVRRSDLDRKSMTRLSWVVPSGESN